MRLELEVSEEVAIAFAAQPGGIERAATEALALEGVRSGRLTAFQARQMLGIFSPYEMDGFLKDHGVFLPTMIEEVIEDSETAAAFAKR